MEEERENKLIQQLMDKFNPELLKKGCSLYFVEDYFDADEDDITTLYYQGRDLDNLDYEGFRFIEFDKEEDKDEEWAKRLFKAMKKAIKPHANEVIVHEVDEDSDGPEVYPVSSFDDDNVHEFLSVYDDLTTIFSQLNDSQKIQAVKGEDGTGYLVNIQNLNTIDLEWIEGDPSFEVAKHRPEHFYNKVDYSKDLISALLSNHQIEVESITDPGYWDGF